MLRVGTDPDISGRVDFRSAGSKSRFRIRIKGAAPGTATKRPRGRSVDEPDASPPQGLTIYDAGHGRGMSSTNHDRARCRNSVTVATVTA